MLLLFGLVIASTALCTPLTRRGLGLTYTDANTLPLLTLPYATYQAQSYDSDKDIYVFANVRYAAPPVGDLRWAAPAQPLTESGIQDGSVGNWCYQSTPDQFAFVQPVVNLVYPQSEDCLFLDVYVPGAAVRSPSTSKLPVLFWIFGGGYVLGSKDQYGGSTLLETSNNSIIFVQTNYRLGAFGWLAGSTFLGEGGVANVGLLDQNAALEWTQNYIAYLGGDPNSITAMGESAGAGSIMHHLTANGGTASPVFKRAILSSPAFFPQYNDGQPNSQFAGFAQSAGCSNLSCLRGLSGEQLQTANEAETRLAPYGQFQFGPAVDGSYVRDLPGRELLAGNFAKDVQVMAGHNSDEGLLFTDPALITDALVNQWISQIFPYASGTVLSQIQSEYPTPMSAMNRYLTEFGRVDQLISETVIDCNCLYLARAYSNNTYNYRFSVTPGIHAQDLLYTFYPTTLTGYNLPLSVPDVDAKAFQSYFISFAIHGDPNTARMSGSVPFPLFGSSENIVDVSLAGFAETTDDELPEDRCAFWQPAPYM